MSALIRFWRYLRGKGNCGCRVCQQGWLNVLRGMEEDQRPPPNDRRMVRYLAAGPVHDGIHRFPFEYNGKHPAALFKAFRSQWSNQLFYFIQNTRIHHGFARQNDFGTWEPAGNVVEIQAVDANGHVVEGEKRTFRFAENNGLRCWRKLEYSLRNNPVDQDATLGPPVLCIIYSTDEAAAAAPAARNPWNLRAIFSPIFQISTLMVLIGIFQLEMESITEALQGIQETLKRGFEALSR